MKDWTVIWQYCRGEDMVYETIKIEIDKEVKRQAEQILETNHLTIEQAI